MPLKLRNIKFSFYDMSVGYGGTLPRAATSHLETRSRAFCAYLYRNFHAPDLEQIRPTRVIIRARPNPEPMAYRVETHGIYADIDGQPVMDHIAFVGDPDLNALSASQMRHLEERDFAFFCDCLDRGLARLERDFGHPSRRLLQLARRFPETGFKTVWVEKTRRPRGLGYEGQLRFEKTAKELAVWFVLNKTSGETVHAEVIWRKRPDERDYWKMMRDLRFEDGAFRVIYDPLYTDGRTYPKFSKPLDQMI